jgi:hypothetical protein
MTVGPEQLLTGFSRAAPFMSELAEPNFCFERVSRQLNGRAKRPSLTLRRRSLAHTG